MLIISPYLESLFGYVDWTQSNRFSRHGVRSSWIAFTGQLEALDGKRRSRGPDNRIVGYPDKQAFRADGVVLDL